MRFISGEPAHATRAHIRNRLFNPNDLITHRHLSQNTVVVVFQFTNQFQNTPLALNEALLIKSGTGFFRFGEKWEKSCGFVEESPGAKLSLGYMHGEGEKTKTIHLL